jgi:hypothetical protein
MILNSLTLGAQRELGDFGSFVAASQLLAAGRDPYSSDHPLIAHLTFSSTGASGTLVNLNPPVSLLLFAGLAQVPADSTRTGWQILSVLLTAVSIAALMVSYPRLASPSRAAWALSLAGFWQLLVSGQVYALVLALSTSAWLSLRARRRLPAAVLVGILVALKPNFVVWPLMLAASGALSTAALALVVAAAVSVLPVLVYGTAVYGSWIRATVSSAGVAFPGNGSLVALGSYLRAPALGVLAAVGLLVALLVLARVRRFSTLDASSLGLIASLLCAPLSWAGYTLALLPVFLSRGWDRLTMYSAGLLCFPIALVLLRAPPLVLFRVGVAWVYGWATLLLLLAILRRIRSGSPSRTEQPDSY